MIQILEELKTLMERFDLSPGEVAQLIGCSQATAYNWLVYQSSSPGPVFQRRVRAAIKKIKRDHYQEFIGAEIHEYFKAVWPILTQKEKDDLMVIVNKGGEDFQVKYLKGLKALAAAKHIKVKGESDD